MTRLMDAVASCLTSKDAFNSRALGPAVDHLRWQRVRPCTAHEVTKIDFAEEQSMIESALSVTRRLPVIGAVEWTSS